MSNFVAEVSNFGAEVSNFVAEVGPRGGPASTSATKCQKICNSNDATWSVFQNNANYFVYLVIYIVGLCGCSI